MYVLKFGGSSVASAEKMKSCGQVIQHYLQQDPGTSLMIVCSALGGVTDLLISTK